MSPLMFRKHNIGLDVRKLSCGVLQTTNAQTSDLEITQLHQTRPSAVWSNVLIWSGLVIFLVSSRLFNAVFFHVYPHQYCRCAA